MYIQKNYSFSELLNSYISLIDKELESFSKLFQRIKETALLSEYLKNLNNDTTFNVFRLISNTYHKENYHSDILRAFLEIKENEQLIYLNAFIVFLNEHFQAKLDKDDFDKTTTIEREKDHIDISIKNENRKKAIIIESKINNAGDQHRQIPKYKNTLEEKGYTVVSIIYLVLDINKEPSKEAWEESERSQIDPILKIISAYDQKNKDLYSWLNDCQNKSDNIDIISTLRQYTKLIKHLGANEMNKRVNEEFLKEIKGTDIRDLAGFRQMLDDIPKTITNKIVNRYNTKEDIKDITKKVWIYGHEQCCAVLDLKYKNIAIDIWTKNLDENFIFQVQVFLRGEGKNSP